MSRTTTITALLSEVQRGCKDASNALFEAVYQDLRRMARGCMADERGDHTLQATALVHEAYMRVFGRRSVAWQNRSQFYAVAARQMHHVLVDHSREYRAQKRDGRLKKPLEDANPAAPAKDGDVQLVQQVLGRLQRVDKVASEVVHMRFFEGMTDQEIADRMEVSTATVRRHWMFARAWMIQSMASGDQKPV